MYPYTTFYKKQNNQRAKPRLLLPMSFLTAPKLMALFNQIGYQKSSVFFEIFVAVK